MYITLHDISGSHVDQAVARVNQQLEGTTNRLDIETVEQHADWHRSPWFVRTADHEGKGFRIAQVDFDGLGAVSRATVRVNTGHDPRAAKLLIEALLHFA